MAIDVSGLFDGDSQSFLPSTRKKRSQAIQIDPDESQSILKSIGQKGLGGLAMVGNVLDLPGSSVRDILKGENPIDQWAPWNMTTSEHRTTGRDLARSYNLAGKKDNWANFFGGLGVELATDPLTYATLGASALGKGGQAAKAAGLMDDVVLKAAAKKGVNAGQMGAREARLSMTLKDLMASATPEQSAIVANKLGGTTKLTKEVMDAPLGGLVGIGMPFGEAASVLGTGKTAQKVAKGLDTAGRFVGSLPGVNHLRRSFDSYLNETQTPLAQTMSRSLNREKDALRHGVAQEAAQDALKLQEAGLGLDEHSDALRSLFELPVVQVIATDPTLSILDVTSPRFAAEMKKRKLGEYLNSPVTMEMAAKAQQLVKNPAVHDLMVKYRNKASDRLARAKEIGLPLEELQDDYAHYIARFMSKEHQMPSGKSQAMSDFDPSSMARNEELKNVLGGTVTLRRMFADQDLSNLVDSGAKNGDIADFIEAKYGNEISPTFVTNADRKTIDDINAANGTSLPYPEQDRYEALAEKLRGLPREVRDTGVFGNHVLIDQKAAEIAFEDSYASANKVLETLKQPGVLSDSAGKKIEGTESVYRLAASLGLQTQSKGGGGFLESLALKMGLATDQKTLKALGQKRIPVKLFDDMVRYKKGFTSPEVTSEMVKAYDWFTNLGKGLMTAPWPNHHNRNFMGAMFQNFVDGSFSFSSLGDVWNLIRGKVVKGASQIPRVQEEWSRRGGGALDDLQATKILGEIVSAYGVSGRMGGEINNLVGNASRMQSGGIEEFLADIPQPGKKMFSARHAAKMYGARTPDTTLNPFSTAGDGASNFGPVASGRYVGGMVEAFARAAPFIKMLREGISAEEAVKRVKAAQVDYSTRNYTKFEREAMTRLFPFYKFTKGALPYTLRTLVERPGGKLSQTIQAVGAQSSADSLTPDYIAESASIPLGGAPEGTDRYLTGFGLMHEDPLSFLGGGIRGGLVEAASRMNPLVKGLAEYTAGESFFQRGPQGGRDLEDLDPSLGRTIANVTGAKDAVRFPGSTELEFLLANSPASKVLTTARQLTDTRKGAGVKALNLLTGTRISDVSPGVKDQLARQLLEKEMKDSGASQFLRTYFPESKKSQMSPAEREHAEKLQAIVNLLAKRAKERANEKAGLESVSP